MGLVEVRVAGHSANSPCDYIYKTFIGVEDTIYDDIEQWEKQNDIIEWHQISKIRL